MAGQDRQLRSDTATQRHKQISRCDAVTQLHKVFILSQLRSCIRHLTVSPYHRNICYLRNAENKGYYNYIIYIIIIIYII